MKNIKFILLTLISISLAACLINDEEGKPSVKPIATDDYFVFGKFYGHCRGEKCIEIYKIENTKIYEDSLDQYPVGLSDFSFVLDSDKKYQLAKNLANNFPAQLLATPDTTLGMPDAYDQGGVYVERKINGVRKYWRLDNHNNNMPDYAVDFVANVTKVMDSLSVE